MLLRGYFDYRIFWEGLQEPSAKGWFEAGFTLFNKEGRRVLAQPGRDGKIPKE